MGTFKREYCIQQKRYKSVEKSKEKIQEKKQEKCYPGNCPRKSDPLSGLGFRLGLISFKVGGQFSSWAMP